MTAPRSISDDDLCSSCKQCAYKPGKLSSCALAWPGHFATSGPREGYCVACPKFEPNTGWNFSRWRHGGWYVHDVRYPSGACGCVSRNYVDKKWRIACDSRPFECAPTFKSRDEAAAAEMAIAYEEWMKPK